MTGLKGLTLAQQHFQAQPSDIFLATLPKSATTWFKALIFSIMNRSRFEKSPNHPLLITGPRDCIPFIEALITEKNHLPNLKNLLSPRLFCTHIPYSLLPAFIPNHGCLIVYVCRNPKDVLVSKWHFMKKLRSEELPPLSLAHAFELFIKRVSHFGSYWDHVLGYWNASSDSANEKVMFLNYEAMKRDPIFTMKRLAEFLGESFSLSEEKEGVVHEIVRLCSFENLSNLEVNRDFFTKGRIGDWKNHLTPEMEESLDRFTEQKFNETGLMAGGCHHS